MPARSSVQKAALRNLLTKEQSEALLEVLVGAKCLDPSLRLDVSRAVIGLAWASRPEERNRLLARLTSLLRGAKTMKGLVESLSEVFEF